MKAKTSKIKKFKRKRCDLVLVEASIGQLSYLDSLIETTTLQPNEIEKIIKKLEGFVSSGEAEELTSYLKDNQRCNIDAGYNYTQTDISFKVAKISNFNCYKK